MFERYKMKSRIELLRNMSTSAWSAIVSTVLSRYGNEEGPSVKGKIKVENAGPDWLRSRLVKEGKELVKRYDQLLPSDSKKCVHLSYSWSAKLIDIQITAGWRIDTHTYP